MYEIRFEADCDTASFHFHEEMEILYVLSGRLGVMTNGSNYVLGVEEFVIFNPFDYHEMYKEAGSHTISAYIPLSLLQQCEVEEIHCCSVHQLEKPEYLSMVRSKLAIIYKYYSGHQPERDLLIKSELYSLLAILKQQFGEKRDFQEGGNLLFTNGKMRQILLYVHEHFAEDISLQDVADHTYVSTGYLSRYFLNLMGVHFSEYLRMLRLSKAIHLLRSTELLVIEIAEECGYQNVNTLITNFKDKYGDTPGSYRKNLIKQREEWQDLKTDKTNFMRLLRHASEEKGSHSIGRKYYKTDEIRVSISNEKNACRLEMQKSISLYFISDFFNDEQRTMLRTCVRELGIAYVCVAGIFNDRMNIYHENLDGTQWFDFIYLDMVLDFICSTGAKPWIELSFTPEKMLEKREMIFNEAYIQLPAHLGKWESLLDNLIEHLIKRYTYEQIRQWRFAIFPPLYISYGLFSLDEYLEYYDCTWKRVRKYLPDVTVTGGTFDVGYLGIDGGDLLTRFLRYCRKHGCMPDEISLQSFAVDYSRYPRKEVERRIMSNIRAKNEPEPAPPSGDRDFLMHHLELVRSVLNRNGMGGMPISIICWNSTMWRNALENDTCYKAAYIVKNCLENAGGYSVLSYSVMMDSIQGLDDIPLVFNGDGGLITYTGIPKAAHYAFHMMSRLGSIILSKGEGYMITCSEDRSSIQVLLYHYCHYNMEEYQNEVIPKEEQVTIDRYYSFEELGIRKFQIYLNELVEGIYKKESFILNRECGSSYDIWRKMGAPEMLDEKQNWYLHNASVPGYQYESMRVRDGEEILLTAALDEHEVRLICFTKSM